MSFLLGANCQAVSGVTSNGQTYLCLTMGTPCPTNNITTPPNNTIDPRIIIPVNNLKKEIVG